MPSSPAASAATLLLSLRGNVLHADPDWAVISGHDEGELGHLDLWQLFHHSDHAALANAIDAVIDDRGPVSLHATVQDAAGRRHRLWVSLRAADDPPGVRAVVLSADPAAAVTDAEVLAAWERGDLTLYAQPIRDAATLATVRHEVLVRLLLPDGRTIAAGGFLPQAERLGLALDIDCWVAEHAVLLQSATGPGAVEINLSAATIRHPDRLLGVVAAALRDHHLDPRRLMVALPGPAVGLHPEASRRLLAALGELGVATALDHVSGSDDDLALIEQLPFDTIKLSGELVDGRPLTDAQRRRLEALIAVVHRRDAEAVAASIDDAAAMTRVCAEGVDALQGYRLGAPMHVTGSLDAPAGGSAPGGG